MKATLEFDLENLQEREAHFRALKSLDMALVIANMFEQFRKVYKYSEDQTEVSYAEKYRKTLADLCEDRGINLDELLS